MPLVIDIIPETIWAKKRQVAGRWIIYWRTEPVYVAIY